jgi:hypothetical protein
MNANPGLAANPRFTVAVAALLLLGVFALAVWSHGSSRSAHATVAVSVTNPADRGPGSLREALFVVAAANDRASILIRTPRVVLQTALPPLVNLHGVSITGPQSGAEIDARALGRGPVFDVTGANTSIAGLVVRNCAGAAVLVRAAHFRLQSSVIDSCDVGVDVAANASDVVIVHDRFSNERIAVRFAAANPDTVVAGNDFVHAGVAGLWAVTGSSAARGEPISVRDNHFDGDHSGVVAGNVAIRIEHNDFTANAADAAVHLVGTGAAVRSNRIAGPAAMGIVAENAGGALIDGNQLERLSAYAIMVRSSANALVRANRVLSCGYGIVFVLGDPHSPGTAVGNIIVGPQFDGIDVIGDSPILKHNQVLRARALALHVAEFRQPGGPSVPARPLLEGNNFSAAGAQTASGATLAHDTARLQ